MLVILHSCIRRRATRVLSRRLPSAERAVVLRSWQAAPPLRADNLMLPIFLSDRPDDMDPIDAMPDMFRFGINRLLPDLIDPLMARGLRSVLLFGVPSATAASKDELGSLADHSDNPVVRAVQLLRTRHPGLVVACDVCLCAYTSHGHCGILRNDGSIDNERSIERIAQVAVAYARAGAHIVAPSDMMDNRVAAIKTQLRHANLSHNVIVMSYSAKFASAFYGPFRDAAKSAPSFGDRKCYQLPPGSRGLARRAVLRDLEEGADIVMVKPGYPYLDVVRDTADLAPNHPVAVYQVSGEYSMLYHATKTHSLVNLKSAVFESVESCIRAGASIIITYWTPSILEWLHD